ncbi:MAG: UDP-2,3-diacylglucosamine diphosphatase LpxI [Mariprofundaceae bacterium]|nr:UDP-2,3-diacylglucosamine diphosphatase LpxI [Mariprofundaceae bacterium]
MTDAAPAIGLIAGYGMFPLEVIAQLKAQGYTVHAIAAKEETSKTIEQYADSVQWLHVGQIGSMIKALQKAKVDEVIMAGKVRKLHLFRNFRPDLVALKSLLSLPNRKDDTLMLEITRLLQEAGIRVCSQVALAGDMLAGGGHLFGPKPSKATLHDLPFGIEQAHGIAALDIGQTIVIQQGAVLAVEAIEGTDEAIRRGGALGNGKAVVIKIAKPNQDLRFDVPAIGPDTLHNMHASGCIAIAIQAGVTLLIEREKLAALANKLKITVYGFEP